MSTQKTAATKMSRRRLEAVGYVQPGRVDKKSLVGYFSKDAHKAVKMLALELDRKVEDLMGEAFHDLLVKYGRPDAAELFRS